MIRILHFADLHLGVETYGRPDPATGLSTRLLDALRALDELVDFALEEQVDLVLFGGDAYRTPQPSQTHQRELARRIRRLVDAGIPVFLVVGNHDLPGAAARATTLEIFETLLGGTDLAEQGQALRQGSGQVFVASTPQTFVVPTRGGPLQVVALPWLTPGRLLTRDHYKTLTADQLLEAMEDGIAKFIEQKSDKLDPAQPAVLAGHVAMRAPFAKSGSERWMTVGRYPEVLKSTLRPEYFDYVALGHHHVAQQIGITTPIVYPGSFQRLDFGEEGDEKGFYLVTLDPTRPRGDRLVEEPQFHSVWARPFVTIEVSPREEDPTPEVVAAVERAQVGEAIVRVVAKVSRSQQTLLRDGEVRQALADAHFVAYIKRELREEARSGRLPPHLRPESLAPLDALRLYWDERQLAADRRETLERYAQALVAAEEAGAREEESAA